MADFIKTQAYADWINGLRDLQSRHRILTRIDKFELSGHPGDTKPIGEGVREMRFDFGPGYRVYYIVLKRTVILLAAARPRRFRYRDGEAVCQLLERSEAMSTAKKEMPAGAALSPYDTAEFLRTPEEIASYLEVVFEEYGDDPRMIAKALGNAARAQGMQKIAKETGISREGLYQALSGKSNPGFDTVLKVLNAVGVELHPKASRRKRRITIAEKQLSRKVSGKAQEIAIGERRFVRDPATGKGAPVGRARRVRKQA